MWSVLFFRKIVLPVLTMGGLFLSGLITWRQLAETSQVSALNPGEILKIDCRDLFLSGNYQLYNVEITGAKAKLVLPAEQAGQPDLYKILPLDFSEDNVATELVGHPIIWKHFPDKDRETASDPAKSISFTGILRSIYSLSSEQYESLKDEYPERYLKKGYVLEPLLDHRRPTAASTFGTLIVLVLCFAASTVWLINGIHEFSGRSDRAQTTSDQLQASTEEKTFPQLDFITGEQAEQPRGILPQRRDRLTPIVSFLTAMVSFLAMRRFVMHLDSGMPLWSEICVGIVALGAAVRWICVPEVDSALSSGDLTSDQSATDGKNLIPHQVEAQIESIIKIAEQQGFVFHRELLGLPSDYCITKEFLSPDRRTLFHLIWYKNEIRLLFFSKVASGTTIITLDNISDVNFSDPKMMVKAGVPENFKKTWSVHCRRIESWSSGLVNLEHGSRTRGEVENLIAQEQVIFAKWFASKESATHRDRTTEDSAWKDHRAKGQSLTLAGLTSPLNPSQPLVPE